MAADPDWTDPCAVLAWIRPQYYKVAAGVSEIKIIYAGRETFYNLASLPQLEAVVRRLESECAAKTGATTGRRRAFRVG